MNRRLPLFLCLLLVLQIIILVLGRNDGGFKLMFPGFKPEDAALIRIVSADKETIELKRADTTWIVANLDSVEADPTAIENLLSDIATMSVGVVQSNRAENMATFGVEAPPTGEQTEQALDTEGMGQLVEIWDSNQKTILSFIAGKPANNSFEMYIRRPDSNEARRVNRNLARVIERGPEEWRDWNIVGIDTKVREKISSITISSIIEEAELQMTRDPRGIWQIPMQLQPDPSRPAATQETQMMVIPPDTASAVVNALSFQRSAGFTEKGDLGHGFDNPTIQVRIAMEDGGEHAYIIGDFNKDTRKFYARKLGSNTVFLMSEGSFNWIMDQLGKIKPAFKDLKPPQKKPEIEESQVETAPPVADGATVDSASDQAQETEPAPVE